MGAIRDIIFNQKAGKEFKRPLYKSIKDTQCPECHENHERDTLIANLLVCPKCGHHFQVPAYERINMVVDAGTFVEFSETLTSRNPISVNGYEEKLSKAREKTDLKDAVVTGYGNIDGHKVVIAVMSFHFMGGSMGSVVGEKITRAMLKGADEELPVIIFTASGGARMQEGIFSLMQMAKTSNAAALMEDLRVPLFIVLTHPTTGGVTASFAMLGDVILSEPDALIGFAGARVSAGTINQKLPEGFQRAEFQLEKGFVDTIVERKNMKERLSFLLSVHPGVE